MRAVRWALVAVAGYVSRLALGPGAGASGREDRRRRLPGDDVLEHPSLSATYAAVIDAPPGAVWPWIVQIAGRQVRRAASPARETPPGRVLHEVGIVTFEPGRVLVMRSTTRERSRRGRAPARIDWVWAFVIEDLGEDRSRVVLRLSSAATPWRAAVVRRVIAVPGEAVRVRRLLAGLARRATRSHGDSGAEGGGAAIGLAAEDPGA